MNIKSLFINMQSEEAHSKAATWAEFLAKNKFNSDVIDRIDMSENCPQVFDKSGNKFSIDFVTDKQNYSKKKASLKNELLSKAVGAGKYGNRILDLSAGLGIDAVFLAQMGYSVTAVERNPLIYLFLNNALKYKADLDLNFKFGEALDILKENNLQADVIYFDPMFPDKSKSALPRQEMVFFKKLVGADTDALIILEAAIGAQGVKRIAVKRPIKAPALKPTATAISGKLIRFDLYQGINGVKK